LKIQDNIFKIIHTIDNLDASWYSDSRGRNFGSLKTLRSSSKLTFLGE